MKNYVVFLFSMFFSIMVFGQNQSTHLPEVEVMAPKFTGIRNVLILEKQAQKKILANYLAAHFEYPQNSNIMWEGTEVIRFNVTPSGELSNFKVINSVSPQIDEEIIGILKTTEGMWKPGYNNGHPIVMEKEVAMEVKAAETKELAQNHDFTQKASNCYIKGTDMFFAKGKPEKAIKYFDEGIRYKPYDKSLYYIRGLCRYEIGYTEGARQDWMRLKKLGSFDMSSTIANYDFKKLKGYQEFVTMFL